MHIGGTQQIKTLLIFSSITHTLWMSVWTDTLQNANKLVTLSMKQPFSIVCKLLSAPISHRNWKKSPFAEITA